jgi:hypothetical protein
MHYAFVPVFFVVFCLLPCVFIGIDVYISEVVFSSVYCGG